MKSDHKERGAYLGGHVPLGWRVGEDGLLVECPAGQAARGRIFELRAGGASLRRIAEIVSRDGVRVSRGGVVRVLVQEQARAAVAWAAPA